LLDDALAPPQFQAGPPSTLQTALEFPRSPAEPVALSRFQLVDLCFGRFRIPGGNYPRLQGAKRESYSFDSRFILRLQISPFSASGWMPLGLAVAAGFDFCNYIIPCGCAKFRTGPWRPSLAQNASGVLGRRQ
jgi:hypothetical protein